MCSIVDCFLPRPMCDVVVFICLIAVGAGVPSGLAQEKPDLPQSEEERESLSGREVRVLRRQMADRESEAEAAFRNAETAFLTGEYDHAVEEFLSVAQEYDDTSYVMRAIVRAADVYYRQERYGRAVSYYQRALGVKSEPWWPEDTEEEYARADYMIGVCFFEQEELNRAFTHFRRFVQEYPESKLVNRAYDFIGRGNMRMERYGQAIEAFQMVGTARLERQERNSVSPGEELYVRIVDEDMAVARRGEALEARVTTESGDEEVLSLQSLGRRAPIFLDTISLRLGPPRHTVELEKAFDDTVREEIEQMIEEAETLAEDAEKLEEDEELAELKQKHRDAERAIRRLREEGADEEDERLEEQIERRDELEKQIGKKKEEINKLKEAAREREQKAYARFDSAVESIEKILDRWNIEEVDEEAADETSTEETDLSDVFTPEQVDAVRVEIREKPTDDDNFSFRRAVVEYWYDQLLYEYKTLDVRGDDVVKIEYIDPHGSGGEEVTHVDELTIASDASVEVVGPDYERSAGAIIIGDRVRVRVEDPDMSRSEGKDTVRVAVASIRAEEDEEDEEDEEPDEEDQETQDDGDERRASVIDPFAEEEDKERPELVPEDAEHIMLELTETEPYSGVFVGSFPSESDDEDGPAEQIEISPDRELRVAYDDERTSTHGDDGWTVVRTVDLVESTEGELQSIELRESSLDRRSQLDKAVAKGKLAEMYMELGLEREADETFEEAIEIARQLVEQEGQSPLGEEATFQMWDLYFKSGRDEAAARAANRLIQAFPDSPLADDALLIMGKATEGGSEAVSHFNRLVKQYPDSPLAPEAQYLAAESRREMPRGGFSVSAYEKVVNQYPDSTYAAKSLLKLSEYYVDERDYERAVDYLDRVMFDFPDFEDMDRATFIRGVCAYRLGNLQRSYKLMHEVIEKYPGTSSAKRAADIVEVLAKRIGN